MRRIGIIAVVIIFASALFQGTAAQQLGASLYVLPPATNPVSGGNFTLTIKVDSLEQPVNAIRGFLTYNKDRIE